MQCPLLLMAWQAKPDKKSFQLMPCLKEDCGWWDHDEAMCSRVSETMELRFIRSILREISDKMQEE